MIKNKSAKIILIVFISIFFSESVYADKFQLMFTDEQTGDTYYVSSSQVLVYYDDGTFYDYFYTDRYGRISLDLERGQYILSVYFEYIGSWIGAGVVVREDQRYLRPVYLQ